ncbi:MAG TPA: hypothetical protein PKL96_09975 [Bacteroidales bacterium]|nr:hypothetical protein [Bacteroidales bacterium]HPS27998.1 hypothetical protein [Bacteroidales bacterium]
MKRTALVIVSVLALSFLTTSCLKDRVCKCTSLINPAMNENYIYEMSNKTTAQANCENQQFDGRLTAADYTCELE